jgi:hypothetical protein
MKHMVQKIKYLKHMGSKYLTLFFFFLKKVYSFALTLYLLRAFSKVKESDVPCIQPDFRPSDGQYGGMVFFTNMR